LLADQENSRDAPVLGPQKRRVGLNLLNGALGMLGQDGRKSRRIAVTKRHGGAGRASAAGYRRAHG
jgi:hypothetical protein